MKEYETELAEPKTIPLDREWVDVLVLEFPPDIEEGTYEVGVGRLSALNCDHRLVLHGKIGRETIQQTIVDEEGWEASGLGAPDEDYGFDTGEERELGPGMKLVLQARFGNFEPDAREVGASIDKASLHASPCWDADDV